MEPKPMTPNDVYDAMAKALMRGDVNEFDRLSDIADAQTAEYEARMRAPSALVSSALWYAKQGIPVFPLQPHGKIPTLRSPHPPGAPERRDCRGECGKQGHGLYDATTDAETITQWWAFNRNYNIGLATGHRFDVLDVDGPAGYQAVGQMRDSAQMPTVYGVARTPGHGGRHYYVPATGGGNRANVRPQLDYRGRGGYVAAPPSRIGDGHPLRDMYEWLEPLWLPPEGN